MERENSNRIHRVGSCTAGLSMVGFGILFLLHYFWKNLDYERIFSIWPLILIGLRAELLLSNRWEKKFIYDKGAIFLLIIMIFFVMGLAALDVCFQAGMMYI